MGSKKKWIVPPAMQPGDRVGIAAPAGPVDAEALERGLKVLRRMGFEPVPGRHVLARSRFLAGEDAARAEDLMTLFRDPGIRGIICARGGYGINRVLPLLDPDVIRRHPKVVVGSSDITLLLGYLNQRCGLVAFHGPMAAGSFGCRSMPQSRRQFRQILTGAPDGGLLRAPRARPLVAGRAEGRLAGGNLTLMCRSLGTPYEIDTRDSILLIEDVNEPPYRIDGMLWQMRQAGKFDAIRGAVIGEMVKCLPPRQRWDRWTDVFMDHLGDLGAPLLGNCPIGHGDEIWTLPLGRRAVLDADRRTLCLPEAAVS
ncbi:MAG: LD-carboxypeptidase [Nitrospinaceae bacterium]